MRPLTHFRSSSSTNPPNNITSSSAKQPFTNGDNHPEETNNNKSNHNGGGERPLIVTRSKTVKVLRSGRRPLLSSPWKKRDDNSPEVNGFLLKNGAINGMSRRCSTRRRGAVSKSPVKIGSAYAKHYKSYRRNSSSCRRNLLANRSSSSSPSKTNNNNPQQARRSLNFNSRLRLRPQCEHAKKSSEGINGFPPPQQKSRSTSASSVASCKEKSQTRRSALWVLNCEAEEFLFGETAADKHELELPPSTINANNTSESPPPKKRRRWRETELSHLLETSPFLESKLRSCSSMASSSSPSDSSTSSGSGDKVQSNPPPPKASTNGRAASLQTSKKKVKTKLCFHSPAKEKSVPNGVEEPSSSSSLRLLSSPFNFDLLSPRPFVDRALHLQETLDNVQWNFSFEKPPVEESWYTTFSRCEDSILSYKSLLLPSYIPSSSPLQLPYQMDKLLLRRSRKKLAKNSRKSPRCHASTLAILSSEPIPSGAPLSPLPSLRSTRNSLSASQPVPPPPPTKVEAPPPSLPLLSKLVSENSSSSSSSRIITKKRNTSSSLKAPPLSEDSFGAQQYLWDSIQFLSDHYVVALLAGDEPPPPPSSSTHHFPYNKSSSISSRTRHTSTFESQRKASLRTIPAPKGSPNKNSTNNNFGVNGYHHRSPRSKPNSPTPQLLSPVVLVTDICKELLSKKRQEEAAGLFMVERLPPLPSWPD